MDVHISKTLGNSARRGASVAGQRMPGRGLRSHTKEVAAAGRLTDAFRGLDAGVTRSMARARAVPTAPLP